MAEEMDRDYIFRLFTDAAENIRFSKRQQWMVAYFALLLYAAIIGYTKIAEIQKTDIPTVFSSGEEFFVYLAIVLVVFLGATYLFLLHDWNCKNRRRLKNIYEKFSEEAKGVLEHKGAIDTSFTKDIGLIVGLLVVLIVGGSAVIWHVYHKSEFHVGMFVVISGLIMAVEFFYFCNKNRKDDP